ncbi:MAG: DUF4199 domain-containing protein [Prevotellaceae bacterium]|jgi:hypothetical protein|nr:DUF4199 domain-containing protein [Prevotellaceae bacterium]
MVRIAACSGIILGFMMIIMQIVSAIAGSSLFLVAGYIAGIIYATVVYREHYLDGKISYGRSLLYGVLVSGFTFIIIGVCLYVWISINSDEYGKMLNAMMNNMKAQGYPVSDISEDLLYNPFFLLASYLITGLLTGLIAATVTSIFTKKN